MGRRGAESRQSPRLRAPLRVILNARPAKIATVPADAPNGVVVEMTYLEPDAKHPLGQAFDGAGNPRPFT